MTKPAAIQTDSNRYTAPIRNCREVAEIMWARGDRTITAGTVWHCEQRALRKLRPLLAAYAEERESS